MLSDHIITSIPDELVFGQKKPTGKYINDPRIIKEVVIIDVFFHMKNSIKSKSKKGKVSTDPEMCP